MQAPPGHQKTQAHQMYVHEIQIGILMKNMFFLPFSDVLRLYGCPDTKVAEGQALFGMSPASGSRGGRVPYAGIQ